MLLFCRAQFYLRATQYGGRLTRNTETKEGIDKQFSLFYYSRMRFIIKLLPLLLASQMPAHVVSVYAAGLESNLFPEDLSLRHIEHQGYSNLRSHVIYMKTLFMEYLAEQHRGKLALSHIYPSLVETNALYDENLPKWFKFIWRWLVAPFKQWLTVPPDECGARIVLLATPRYPPRQTGTTGNVEAATTIEDGVEIAMGSDGVRGSGAYALNWNGEPKEIKKAYEKFRRDEMTEKVWLHTMRAFEEIKAGNVFTG